MKENNIEEFEQLGFLIKPDKMACLNTNFEDDEDREYKKSIQYFMNRTNYVCIFAHLDDKIKLQTVAARLAQAYPKKKIELRINNLIQQGNLYIMNMEKKL